VKALLVYPQFPVTYWGFQYGLPIAGKKASLPPLGLITLGAELPPHWSLRLVDLNVRDLDDAELAWADVVLVGGMRIQAPSMHEILARARALGRRAAVGGPAPSTAPDDWPDADVVFIGEAEGRIDGLAEALEGSGRCVLAAPAERPDMTRVPLPRYDLLDLDRYASVCVQYSRGCPFSCEFCDIIEIFGRVPRVKTNAQVLAELDQLYDLGYRGSVFFVDDNFVGNKPAVKRLLPRLAAWQRERGHPYELYTEASVNLAADEPLMDGMVAAGFASVFLGIETLSPEALLAAKKKQNLRLDLNEAVDRLTRRGLEVMGGFIVGFDEDGPHTFDLQHGFITSVPVPLAMVGLLSALPDTQLWRRLDGEGRLRNDWNGDQFERPNFEPVMDEALLLSGYADLMRRLYSAEAYYARCEMYVQRAPSLPGRRKVTFGDVVTFVRTCLRVGVASGRSLRYWKLLLRALLFAPHCTAWVVSKAIQGEHMIRYTANDVLPRIERALAEVRRELALGFRTSPLAPGPKHARKAGG
jgi:radical SAM superfamily enzyme YgiQ (UPF0313 family)